MIGLYQRLLIQVNSPLIYDQIKCLCSKEILSLLINELNVAWFFSYDVDKILV